MNILLRRRTLLQASLAMGAAVAAPAARACEFWTTRLRVLQPWTRATLDGDPHAVVCMTFDLVTGADRLVGVETPVASGAEMGGRLAAPVVDFAIAAGADSALTEAGTFIRLTGLRHALEIGRTYPLTLIFEKGGAVAADLDVTYERRS